METGGGQGGENCKTAEIVLVFYVPGTTVSSYGKNNR